MELIAAKSWSLNATDYAHVLGAPAFDMVARFQALEASDYDVVFWAQSSIDNPHLAIHRSSLNHSPLHDIAVIYHPQIALTAIRADRLLRYLQHRARRAYGQSHAHEPLWQ